ncbi:SDR family oxidoreductase [Kitasatospora sp. RB6PN24]|uniref:SDR family oxidoreductase n=1 Tax=Kitasatospora humi TaxID=2893891 RepID=UPI001E2EB195|nr:SDR family oxidoreductase [Kitasatospora humi]MCC9311376.1 SDR family oxidoreductase [Kitasatospora humi]
MIVVTGATGTVGSKVVSGLRERGESVRALVRDPGSRPAGWDEGVEVVAADYTDPTSLDTALAGADVIYLLVAVHPEMAQHEINVIDAAVRTGLRPRIVLHAAAGVEVKPEGVRFLSAHVTGHAHLQAGGLPWTVLAPNGFHQNFLGMAAAVKAGRLTAAAGDAPVSWVDARDVAEAAVAVLTTDGHEGAVYTLTGPAGLTHDEIADQLGAVAGRTVAYQAVEPEAALAGMLAAGWDPWRAEGLIELYTFYAGGGAGAVTHDVEKLTGHAPRSFADFAADHAAVFRG